MPKAKKTKPPGPMMKQTSLLDLLGVQDRDDARDTIRAMLAIRNAQGRGLENWRGLMAVPPGTFIERVVSEFQRGTDIPLEIPFFIVLHWLAGHLLHNDVVLRLPSVSRSVRPDLWTVLLASSGAGKSFTEGELRTAIGDDAANEIEFPGTGIASGAAFVEALAEKNKTLWVRDEFGQFLRQIAHVGGNLEELKDLLLRIHDGHQIMRRTKQYTIAIENPALAILGLAVGESFARQVSPEDMVDGFAQRFSYVIAEKDPKRPMRDFPLYQIHQEGWGAAWKRLTDSVKHTEYIAGPDAIQGYDEAFRALIPTSHIPESFYRRILWRAHKYALVYHVLTGRGECKELDSTDYGWAARAVTLHVSDALKLLAEHGLGELERALRRVEELKAKATEEGRELTARDVIRSVNSVKTARQAYELMSLAK
jgi:hypothetical protein